MARNNKQPLNGIFTGKSGHHNGTHAGANGFVERPSAQSILNGIEHQFPGSRKAVKQSMGSRSVTNFPIDWKTLRSLKHPPYIDKREISDDDRRALEVLLGISAAVTIAYNGLYRLKVWPLLKGKTPDDGGTWEEAELFCQRYNLTLATIRNQSRETIAHAVNVKFTLAPKQLSQAELIAAGVIPKPR